MSAGRHSVYVNGRPLGEVGSWRGLKYSHARSGGSLRASWAMDDDVRHPNLYWGASVTLTLGGSPIWWGYLNEPGRDGAMSALGLAEQGKGALCITSTGATTAEPRDAVAQAMARGRLRWSSPVPDIYPGSAAQQMDAPYPAQYVTSLLDRVASEQGVNWFIDPFTGALATAPDPTTPTVLVPALVAGRGLTPAADSVATHLLGEFITGPGQRALTNPAIASPDYVSGSPSLEQLVTLIDKGFINSTQAAGYLTNMFGKSVGKVGWADGLQFGAGDVTTLGGTALEPSAVMASPPTMVRLAGVWDDRSANPYPQLDVVLDETEYDEDSNTVQAKPVGLETRTIGEAMTWLAS